MESGVIDRGDSVTHARYTFFGDATDRTSGKVPFAEVSITQSHATRRDTGRFYLTPVPGLDELMRDARRGRFDVGLVWASDRIATK